MRLDRFLSHATGLPRSQAQRAVRRGAVRVDGAVVSDPGAAVTPAMRVEYQGRALALTGPRYYMLHKPAGCVCATHDAEHRTVLDLLDVPNKAKLCIVGRLDLDATGLVLVTDDGAWSHRVTAPRKKVEKTYLVTLVEALTDAAAAALAAGVPLRGEPKPCAPAQVQRLSERQLRLTITEGKYHQVKRMLAAVGNHVLRLHRERIGAIALDAALAEGQARALTADEIAAF